MGITFIGSQPIGHDCLKKILDMNLKVDAVFTFLPDPHEKWEKSVDTLAKEYNIPIFLHKQLTESKIKEIHSELIVVVGYRKLFSKSILTIPKNGVVGLHASLLPHLRGQAPLNWAIINGDKKTGITMFIMNEGIDTGEIVAQKETIIKINDTILEIKKRIQKLAVELVEENIPRILSSNVKLLKQPKNGTYGAARIPEDSRINWNESTKKIYDLIRGSEPSYPAFTYLNSKKLFITKSTLIDDKNIYYGTPGQVGMTYKDGSVAIITKDGAIKIQTINYNNKEVNAKIILNSTKLRLH